MRVKHPKFKRQNTEIKKRVRTGWRKPRGIDNKLRVMLKSAGYIPRIGYYGSRESRHKLVCGLKEKLVCSLKDLEGVDAKKFAVRIRAGVGALKRKAIVVKAKELGLKLLN